MDETAAARPPLQARSRRTLARIVDAGLALMAEGGADSVTVQSVVARAHVSVGSFYARFAGRDELLRHLHTEAASRERTRWESELAGRLTGDVALEARVRAIVALLVSVGPEISAQTLARLHDTAANVLIERRREIRHPDPEAAIEMGYAAVRGAARHRPPGWTDERLNEELARMWLAYLGVGANEAASDKQDGVDYFHVWA